MSTVVTVMNMKGGVGKTTVTVHLGGIMSRVSGLEKKPRRVLLIDYDAQFNLSQTYLPSKQYFSLEKDRKTILSVLQDDDASLDPYVLQVPGSEVPPPASSLASTVYDTKAGRLDIIPSTLDLMYVALGNPDNKTKTIEDRFRKFIAECRSKYDIIFIDCHPAGSVLTKTALTNSDHVLIPVAPDRYAVRGISLMMEFIEAKKVGGQAPIPHIIFNKVPRTGHVSEELAIRANPKYSKYCLSETLRRYSAFTDPQEGKGFVWYSSKPYSTEAYRNLLAVAAEFGSKVGV